MGNVGVMNTTTKWLLIIGGMLFAIFAIPFLIFAL